MHPKHEIIEEIANMRHSLPPSPPQYFRIQNDAQEMYRLYNSAMSCQYDKYKITEQVAGLLLHTVRYACAVHSIAGISNENLFQSPQQAENNWQFRHPQWKNWRWLHLNRRGPVPYTWTCGWQSCHFSSASSGDRNRTGAPVQIYRYVCSRLNTAWSTSVTRCFWCLVSSLLTRWQLPQIHRINGVFLNSGNSFQSTSRESLPY